MAAAARRPELTANWLGALAMAAGAAQRAATRDAGSESRAAALLTLLESPRMPIGELAGILGLSHSATVRVVDGLEDDGLVARGRSPRDSRSAELMLTAAGRRRAQALRRARLRSLERLLSPLTDAQRAQFTRLLAGVLAGVTEERAVARFTCRFCAHGICSGRDCPIGSSVGDGC